MSVQASLSASEFSRLFRQVSGQSPRQYVIATRMARARILLRESDLSQAKLAEMLGFSDVYFFNRQFSQYHGVSPGRFRGA